MEEGNDLLHFYKEDATEIVTLSLTYQKLWKEIWRSLLNVRMYNFLWILAKTSFRPNTTSIKEVSG